MAWLPGTLAMILLSAAAAGQTIGNSPAPAAPPAASEQEKPSAKPGGAETKSPTPNPPATEPTVTKSSESSDSPAAMSLEEMLDRALRDHPDILVAEANLRAAEAELNRTRLQVAEKVLLFRQTWLAQTDKVKAYKAELDRVRQLYAAAAASTEELAKKQVSLIEAQATLATLEAEMPYLVGKQPAAGMSGDRLSQLNQMVVALPQHLSTGDVLTTIKEALPQSEREGSVGFDATQNAIVARGSSTFCNNVLAIVRALERSGSLAARRSKQRGEMADRIRQKLDEKVSLEFVDTPIGDVLGFLTDLLGNVGFHLSGQLNREQPVSIAVDQVPLAAALQALEDRLEGATFIAREYGIMLTDRVPRDGVRVLDLWREQREEGAGVEPTKPR